MEKHLHSLVAQLRAKGKTDSYIRGYLKPDGLSLSQIRQLFEDIKMAEKTLKELNAEYTALTGEPGNFKKRADVLGALGGLKAKPKAKAAAKTAGKPKAAKAGNGKVKAEKTVATASRGAYGSRPRHTVRVDGTEYPSIMKAFKSLDLDTKKHGLIRSRCIAAGKPVEFEGHKFEVIN